MTVPSRGPICSVGDHPTQPLARAPVSLDSVRPLLRGLDRDQRAAVTHAEGALLVIAGPGTGKTEVLTRRVAWLIATKRARPSEILALTFTDKAAEEMQARVDLLVPYGQADAAIHTFHAFGDQLIRESGFELGVADRPRVINRAEAIVLLREHLFELGLERYRPLADPTRFLDALVDLIGRAKDEGIAASELAAYATELGAGAEAVVEAAVDDGERLVGEALTEEAAGYRELAAAAERYQALLVERNLVDFGDQVALAARLLEERPSVRLQLQRRFRYVLVDEFQDTNPTQLALVRSLAGQRANVTVVGDDDQAIYAFRGAAVEHMLAFGASFPGARRIVLRRNHRSRGPILAAAQRLIRHNDPYRLETQEGVDKTLVAQRRGRGAQPVTVVTYATDADEADGVAEAIRTRIEAGARPSDVCVLVRTNADAERFLRSLQLRGIPWRSAATSGLYSRPEVRDLLAFLRATANPDSTVDLYAVAAGEPYRLGGEDLTRLLEMARRHHRSLWSACLELLEQPGLLRLSADGRRALGRLVADLRAAIELSHERPSGEVLYAHLKQSGRLAALVAAGETGDDVALRNVARFFDVVRAHSAILTDDRVAFLVPHLATLVDAGDDPASVEDGDTDAVAVMTVHKAKGLEFPVVHLVGLADGRFPMRGRRERLALPEPLRRPGLPHEAPHAEERRLCFVGMTRARDELVLSHSRESASGRARRPSTFIAEALDAPHATAVHGSSDAGALATRLDAALGSPKPAGATATSSGLDPERSLSLSYSQIDDYLTCPLKYRLRHAVGVPTPPHHALVLGNALHQAVAAFHTARIRGRIMDESELLEVFVTHWSSEGFLSRHHEEARFAAGRDALRRFHAQQLAGAPAPTAVERPFSVRLGRDTVRGRYDRLDTTAEGTIITDYKSSDVRDPKQAQKKARDSLQLQLYALAHEAETGALPKAVELHFLESGVVGRVEPDAARLEKARTKLAEAADGIRAGRFEARPDYLACGYCPYRDICPQSAA